MGLYVFPLFSYNKPRGTFFNIAFGPGVHVPQMMVNSGARQNGITTIIFDGKIEVRSPVALDIMLTLHVAFVK